MNKIVKATENEVSELAPLFDAYRQFYGFAADLTLAEQFLTDRLRHEDSVVWLAYDRTGTPIGFTQMYPSFSSTLAGKVWILYDLFVREAGRQQGIGRQLMETAIFWARSTDAVEVSLATATDNFAAQRLYVALGFQKDTDFWVYSLDPR